MSGGLISILQRIVNQSPHDSDINIIIARYLLKHLYQENLSINTVADDCHISKASVTRFAQHLGFEGFNDLKASYHLTFVEQEEMKIDLEATSRVNGGTKRGPADLNFEAVLDDMQRYCADINTGEFDRFCELIHTSSNVHLYATSIPGNMAEILQHVLLTAGKYVEYYPQLPNQLEAAKKLNKGDLAIFISLEGSYVMQKDLTLSITGSEATSVLVTQNPQMKLASVFDQVFPLGEHGSERSGKYKLLLFVEYLAHRYFLKYV